MILHGDALAELKKLESCIVQTCVTSPPYWGLRDYGVDGQLGLENTPEEYTAKLVEIFAEVKRVLKDDGTLWLVIGDSYAGGGRGCNTEKQRSNRGSRNMPDSKIPQGTKPKDLVGIPWRVAFALQADGWYLRSDIIWTKPNPMPESVTDRPTKAHEYIFLLAKSQRYFYDAEAIKEPAGDWGPRDRTNGKYSGPDSEYPLQKHSGLKGVPKQDQIHRRYTGFNERYNPVLTANKRTVWTVTTKPYPEAHFAVYPPDLIEPCILAGSAEGDIVLDPFMGSGTTGEVAIKHKREFIGIELNADYIKLAEKRLREVEVVMF